jgi:DNA-binding GntR family transcriptional regulator
MPPVDIPTPSKTGRLAKDPVCRRLSGLLQEPIRAGEFKAGQPFLTEREVGERFGVSRSSVDRRLRSGVAPLKPAHSRT